MRKLPVLPRTWPTTYFPARWNNGSFKEEYPPVDGDPENLSYTSHGEEESKAHTVHVNLSWQQAHMQWESWGAEGWLALHNCQSWHRLSTERSRNPDAGVHTCFQLINPEDYTPTGPQTIWLFRLMDVMRFGFRHLEIKTTSSRCSIYKLPRNCITVFSPVVSDDSPLGIRRGPGRAPWGTPLQKQSLW